MKEFIKLAFWLVFCAVPVANSIAHDLNFSGRNEIFDNPFIVTGFNKASGVVTGSISATRTAPGETNECRIVFSGERRSPDVLKVRYFEVGAEDGVENISKSDQATVVQGVSGLKIKFSRKKIVGECDWLLTYVNAPSIEQQGSELTVLIPKLKVGDWIGIYTIKSRRANFHKMAGGADVEKAFLVAGDMIYVYEEQPGWYYVKFQGRKSKRQAGSRKQTLFSSS
jgi:hypothetical protein